MATYVVGDIQGCLKPLEQLLKRVQFDRAVDCLWVAGDLVNRGPDNLGVLRLIKNLGASARVVLGNHDLHLLAADHGSRPLNRKDTIADVLQAPDKTQLLDWLRRQPLIYCEGPWVMSHAGVPHIWSVSEAEALANEVHTALSGWQRDDFFDSMYGDKPAVWNPNLRGMQRLRLITNYFTRMRFIDVTGELDLSTKEGSDQGPPGVRPWFVYTRKAADAGRQFLFGHWAALEGKTARDGFYALDTGYVWGGKLTMMRLEDGEIFQQDSDTTP